MKTAEQTAVLIGVIPLPIPIVKLARLAEEYPEGSTMSQTGSALWIRSAGEKCWGCMTCVQQDAKQYEQLTGEMLMPTFIVCIDCGNKRCPRATRHDLDCTGSNEPGQPGSVYGPTPGCARCTYSDHGPGREAHVDGAGRVID